MINNFLNIITGRSTLLLAGMMLVLSGSPFGYAADDKGQEAVRQEADDYAGGEKPHVDIILEYLNICYEADEGRGVICREENGEQVFYLSDNAKLNLRAGGNYETELTAFIKVIKDDEREIIISKKPEAGKEDGDENGDGYAGKEGTCNFEESFCDEGNYRIAIWCEDMEDNKSDEKNFRIVIDKTPPEVAMVSDHTGENWTNDKVVFDTKVSDEGCGLSKVIYKVDGKIVKQVEFDSYTDNCSYRLVADKNAADENGYMVETEVCNNCGVVSSSKRKVRIDKEKPEISLSGIENGMHYACSKILRVDVNELSYKDTRVEYIVTKEADGEIMNMAYAPFAPKHSHDMDEIRFTEEGCYSVKAVATDGAGNVRRTGAFSFVIDKTAPELYITGVENGSVNSDEVIINFGCVESFYETDNVALVVERTLDGKKTSRNFGNFARNDREALITEKFSEDGKYKVTFTATDRAGNIAERKEVDFIIDRTKPVIEITGTENYGMWNEPVNLNISVTEAFYKENEVSIKVLRADEYGNTYKVELPEFSNYNKKSVMTSTFDEDGIYELTVVSKDVAGNKARLKIHFTLDRGAPYIGAIEEYDGKSFKRFDMADKLKNLFRDLTVVSCRILLNGIEYNGRDIINIPGKYELYVEAVDELGNAAGKSVEFLIVEDTTEIDESTKDVCTVKKLPEDDGTQTLKESQTSETVAEDSGKTKGAKRFAAGLLMCMGIVLIPVMAVIFVLKKGRKNEGSSV